MFILVILGRMNDRIYVHEHWWATMDSWRYEGHNNLKATGNGGSCLHNMRMRRNKSAGRMVNSAASRCVYTRRQVSSGTLEFLQQNPWLTRPERLWLLQTWSTCKRDPLAVDFVSDNPPSSSSLPPPVSPSLSPSQPPVTMTTKASLSVPNVQSVHLGGYQSLLPLPCVTAALLFTVTQRRFHVLSHAHVLSHHPLFPASRKGLIQDRCFVLVCSTTWQQEQRGGVGWGGGVKRFMRTLLLVFEVPRW